jgi:hypothetical protein
VLWGLVAIVAANAGSMVAWIATAFVLVVAFALVLRRVSRPLPA